MTYCWLLCFSLGLHITSKNTSRIYLICLWSFVVGDIGELLLLRVNLQFQTHTERSLEICTAICVLFFFVWVVWTLDCVMSCCVIGATPHQACKQNNMDAYADINTPHKSACMFCKQKHTSNAVQSRVCLVWDPSQASHIPHNTRAGAGTSRFKVGYPTDFWSPAVQIWQPQNIQDQSQVLRRT